MIKLLRNRKFLYGTALAAGIFGLGIGQAVLQKQAEAQTSTVQAPVYEVDPLWPKPLPNNWLLGWTIGVWVDDLDHIWIIHRGAGGLHNNERGAELNPPIAECCRTAPPILVYDADGSLLRSWGGPGPGYEWPQSNHGIHVDYKGNVWIGGQRQEGRPDPEVHQRRQVHHAGRPLGRQQRLERPRELRPRRQDLGRSEVERGLHRRRLPQQARRAPCSTPSTGKMKRHWGAYGNKPDDSNLGPYDPTRRPRRSSSATRSTASNARSTTSSMSCDRQNDRLQVFKPDGTFVKEKFFAKNTLGAGSVWDIVFSKDPQQRFIMLADGQNERVRVIVRDTLEEITSFGDGGRQPGQFYGVHSIASDSKGNLYTTETYEGKRVQRFVYKGIASVPLGYQGVPWPKKS